MPQYYLAQNAKTSSPLLELLPAFYLDEDTGSSELSDRGFRYALFPHTGARLLVRPRGNRRWLEAWKKYVTDFDVFEVDTVVASPTVPGAGFAIMAGLGPKHPHIRRLFAQAGILDSSDYLTNPARKSGRGGSMKAYDYKTRNQLEELSWPGLQAELKRLEAQARRIDRVLSASHEYGVGATDQDAFDEAIDERTAWTKAYRQAQEVELHHEDEREDRQRLVGRVIYRPSGKSAGWNRYKVVGIGTKPGILIVQRKRVDGGLQATKERLPSYYFNVDLPLAPTDPWKRRR